MTNAWQAVNKAWHQKNYLVIGCSFSTGTHTYSKGANPMNEKLYTRVGWYSYVDWFKNYNVTVIACPGQGYTSWLQILNSLEKTKKIKKYDKIIIQETNEPRITFLEPKELEINVLNDFLISDCEQLENIKHVRCNPLNLDHEDSMKPNELRCFRLDTRSLQIYSPKEKDKKLLFNQDIVFYTKGFLSKILVERCAELVQDICEKHDIPGYVWSIGDPVMKCNYLTRIPFNNIGKVVSKLGVRTNKTVGHLTVEGNKFIGKNIQEILCNEN